MQEIAAQELDAWLKRAPPVLLDVRESWEVDLCRLAGAVHIPLGELVRQVDELDPAMPTVVLCHHGVRSLHAAEWLAARGFASVFNLAGGIDAWARDVEPGMRRY